MTKEIFENVSLSFTSPVTIMERLEKENNVVKVGGLAVPAQESRNGRTYKLEDLHAAKFGGHAFSEGNMLTMGLNHSTDVTDNVGKWSPSFTERGIEFSGVVYNTEKHPYLIGMLDKGLLPYVSVEMTADLVKEGDVLYAKNQDVLGLDFVKVPGLADASVGIAEAFEKAYAKVEDKPIKGDKMVKEKIIEEEEEKPQEEEEEKPAEEEEKDEPEQDKEPEASGESMIDKLFERFDKKVESLESKIKKIEEKPQSKGIVTEKEKPEFNLTFEKVDGKVNFYSEDVLY